MLRSDERRARLWLWDGGSRNGRRCRCFLQSLISYNQRGELIGYLVQIRLLSVGAQREPLQRSCILLQYSCILLQDSCILLLR